MSSIHINRDSNGKLNKNKLLEDLKQLSYIDQLKFLVENFRDTYARMIQSIDYLNQFVNANTKDLNDSFYRMPTKLFWIFNNIKSWKDSRVRCKTCGKPLKNKNVQIGYTRYPKYCNRSCQHLDKDVQEKYAKTCLTKFGVDHNFKSKDCLNKRKQTWIKNLGVDNPSKSIKIQNKKIQTNQKNHNINWWNNIEQIKNTNIKNLGVEFPFQSTDIQHKCQESNLHNNGHKNPAHGYGAQEKIQKTMLRKYNSLRAPQFKYIYDNQSYDSAWEVYFIEYCKINNINVIKNDSIFFEYTIDNKCHKYFPDFIINDSIFIELKGDHFFKDKDISKTMICPWNRKYDYIYEAKHQCMLNNNVKILTSIDLNPIISSIKNIYGNKWINAFKQKNVI